MAAWQADVAIAGRYRLVERLGAGGVAEVWRATDTVLQRDVAVKLLLERLADDVETVTRFRREASTAAGISHPNAVVIYDVGEQDDVPFLVMELVAGPTLAAVLRAGPLDATVTAAIGHQIAGALGAAHERGLVHRDVKPANVLLSPAGVAKLADFGIATALGPAASRLTDPGNVVGTAGYLSPEQLEFETVDARSDVYALGLVLHECLTGEPVFGDGTPTEIAARRLTQDPPPLRGIDAPAELLAAIVKATRRLPPDRFEDGRALARALGPLVPEGIERRLARLDPGPATRPLPVEEPVTDPVAATRVVHRDEPATGPTAGDAYDDHAHGGRANDGDGNGGGIDGDRNGRDADGRDAMAPTEVVPVVADGVVPPATTTLVVDDDRPAAPGPSAPDGGPSFWRRNGAPLVVALIVLAALLTIGVTAGDGGGDGAGAGPDAAGAQLASIASAQDVDPFGDGREHADDVRAAYDGDPATDWSTERYDVADLAAIKSGGHPGVGLLFDLGDVRDVRRLQLVTGTPGVRFSVYGWETLPELEDPTAWGEPLAVIDGADPELAIDLERAGRYWLVWFTDLAPDDGGFRARVNELAFLAVP